jgi:hypothetical protein
MYMTKFIFTAHSKPLLIIQKKYQEFKNMDFEYIKNFQKSDFYRVYTIPNI